MKELTISIEPQADIEATQVVHFDGAFDGSNKEPLASIEQLINSEEKMNLIFDFANLSYLNSYAIGQLVAWHNHLKKNQGQIIVTGPSKNVEDIFGILGIQNLFKIFPDLQSALDSLKA